MSQVTKSTAEVYRIRKGFEWATICLTEHRPRPDITTALNYGGEILIHSSFGNFAHHWTHCASDFKQFLSEVDVGYFMAKAAHPNTHKVFDPVASYRNARRFVLDLRRDGTLDKKSAREAMSVMEDLESASNDEEFVELYSSASALGAPFRCFAEGCWELVATCLNPQYVEFWNNLWPIFLAELAKERT